MSACRVLQLHKEDFPRHLHFSHQSPSPASKIFVKSSCTNSKVEKFVNIYKKSYFLGIASNLLSGFEKQNTFSTDLRYKTHYKSSSCEQGTYFSIRFHLNITLRLETRESSRRIEYQQ